MHVSDDTTYYEHGFPIGGVLVKQGSDKPIGYALNNHLDFTVMYNEKESKNGFVIVGFEIKPRRFVHMTVSHSFSVYYTDSDSVQKMCNKDHVPFMVIQGEALRKGEKVTLFSIPNR